MSKLHLDLVRHIYVEADFLMIQSSALSKNGFLNDEIAKRAFVRSFEIIGEASKNIPDRIKRIYPEVEWKEMARLRDRLIHHYFGVDYEIVWGIVNENIPILKIQMMEILQDSGKQGD
ncbi:MAG: DUF86 domain-containing protein [Candidatus Aegiribacteria sp.]|nr:DUF86 domain-containing protein [Candidatus Aegiribacteria sp.]